jgi:CheY-like chemotaxis protein
MNESQNDSLKDELSILIVDDNSVDRSIIKANCAQLNCRLDTAASGPEALEKFAKHRHQLVITDYMMEPMNGLELAKRLREIEPKIECILVSGYSNPEVLAYVECNDLSPLVEKPIRSPILLDQVLLTLKRFGLKTEDLKGVSDKVPEIPELS